MEDESKYADRKSRLVFERAGKSAPELRTVGSITLLSPQLDAPLHLDGLGYTVYFKESEKQGDLREAMVILSHAYRRKAVWWEIVMYSVFSMVVGWGLHRLYAALYLQ